MTLSALVAKLVLVSILCVRSPYSCQAILAALTLCNTEGKEMGRRMARALPVVIINPGHPVLTEAISVLTLLLQRRKIRLVYRWELK